MWYPPTGNTAALLRPLSLLSLIAFLLLPAAPLRAQEAAPPLAAPTTVRPRVGLVLAGGSAYGFAHLGVLKWMEQNRIPVDYLSGTSMGSLVGGFYATGLSVSEIERQMARIDWESLFRATTPHPVRTFRRKEDLREFENNIEFGRGFATATGIDSIHPVGILLSRAAFPYPNDDNFDDLPIPFRCVAVDLDAAKPVIFNNGSLAQAMRASMSIPLVFTTVESRGRTYVDGGVFDNLPVGVMVPGPERPAGWSPGLVITSRMEDTEDKKPDADVGATPNVPRPRVRQPPKVVSSSPGSPRPTNLFDVITRLIAAVTTENMERSVQALDTTPGLVHVPIVSEVTGFAPEAFANWRDFEKRGYAGAEKLRARLIKYQLTPDEWTAYLAAKNARRKRVVTPRLLQVTEQDVSRRLDSRVVAYLRQRLRRYIGRRFTTGTTGASGRDADPVDRNSADLERDLNELTGSGLFESIAYDQTTVNGQPALAIRAKEKSYGPPFFLAAGQLDSGDASNVQALARVRANLIGRGFDAADEVRADVIVGSRRLLAVEYYRPTPVRPVFVLPFAYTSRELRDFSLGPRPLAQYTVNEGAVGLDVGLDLGKDSQFRVGYRLGGRDYDVQSVAPGAIANFANGIQNTSRSGDFRGTVAQFAYDAQDDPVVPLHGNYTLLRGAIYDRSPLSRGYGQATIYTNQAISLSRRDALHLTVEAGKQIRGTAPAAEQFRLGGPYRLASRFNGELRGENYSFYSLGYLRRVSPRFALLGGAIYGGLWYENGLVTTPGVSSERQQDLHASLFAPTHLGPFSGGISLGDQGARRFYVRFGRLF